MLPSPYLTPEQVMLMLERIDASTQSETEQIVFRLVQPILNENDFRPPKGIDDIGYLRKAINDSLKLFIEMQFLNDCSTKHPCGIPTEALRMFGNLYRTDPQSARQLFAEGLLNTRWGKTVAERQPVEQADALTIIWEVCDLPSDLEDIDKQRVHKALDLLIEFEIILLQPSTASRLPQRQPSHLNAVTTSQIQATPTDHGPNDAESFEDDGTDTSLDNDFSLNPQISEEWNEDGNENFTETEASSERNSIADMPPSHEPNPMDYFRDSVAAYDQQHEMRGNPLSWGTPDLQVEPLSNNTSDSAATHDETEAADNSAGSASEQIIQAAPQPFANDATPFGPSASDTRLPKGVGSFKSISRQKITNEEPEEQSETPPASPLETPSKPSTPPSPPPSEPSSVVDLPSPPNSTKSQEITDSGFGQTPSSPSPAAPPKRPTRLSDQQKPPSTSATQGPSSSGQPLDIQKITDSKAPTGSRSRPASSVQTRPNIKPKGKSHGGATRISDPYSIPQQRPERLSDRDEKKGDGTQRPAANQKPPALSVRDGETEILIGDQATLEALARLSPEEQDRLMDVLKMLKRVSHDDDSQEDT